MLPILKNTETRRSGEGAAGMRLIDLSYPYCSDK